MGGGRPLTLLLLFRPASSLYLVPRSPQLLLLLGLGCALVPQDVQVVLLLAGPPGDTWVAGQAAQVAP